MSKKRLSRTVIEGGRSNWSKYERRNSNSEARAKSRAHVRKLLIDPEAGEFEAEPRRKKASRGFSDKLNPAYQWLERHVGQPWDEVYSKLLSLLDTRTISGRHIVFDHMLSCVAKHEYDVQHSSREYVVNSEGILCYNMNSYRYQYRLNRKKYRDSNKKLPANIGPWLRDRMVREVGSKVFWMIPQKYAWMTGCTEYRCWRRHRIRTEYRDVPTQRGFMYHRTRNAVPEEAMLGPVATMRVPVEIKECWRGTGGHRQWRELSAKDTAFYRSFPDHWKEDIGYLSQSEYDAKQRRLKLEQEALLASYKKR